MSRARVGFRHMLGQRASSCVYNVSRVPHDVWLGIWRLLSFSDRRTVTRVCKAWRKAALGTSGMWTELDFYTTLHARGCGCAYCEPRQGPGPTPVGWSGYRGVHWTRSNMRFAIKALSLSGEQLLDITIEIMPYLSRRDELEALAQSLIPHAARIRSLSIKSADLSGYAQFMARFGSFTKLETFTATLLENEQDHQYHYQEVYLIPRTLEFPLLREIHVDRFFYWPEGGVSFPELRHISVAPNHDVAGYVQRALCSCPRRERFRLNLQSYAYSDDVWASSSETDDAIRVLASSLRSVEILGLERPSQSWARYALTRPTLPSLLLDYSNPEDGRTGLESLSELPGRLTLRVAMRNAWPDCPWADDYILLLDLENERGHSRRLAIHQWDWGDPHAHELLDHLGQRLEGRAMGLVTTDYVIWGGISGTGSLGCYVEIDTWQVILVPGDIKAHYDDPAERDAEEEENAMRLRALTLVYGRGPLVLTARAIAGVVHSMNLRLPLEVLSIDSRISITDAHKISELAAVARSVVVQPCYVPDIVFPPPLPELPAEDDAESSHIWSDDDAASI